MFLRPYQGENHQHSLSPDQAAIYDEIWNEAGFPLNAAYGNCYELLNYYASGEASDWILYNTGIIATSPELGSENAQTFDFDIPSVRTEARVILKNMGLPDYLIRKATAQIAISKAEGMESSLIQRTDGMQKNLSLALNVTNKGLSDA